MVGCRLGQALARVGLVDHTGAVIYESFVFVHPDNVTDYRTSSSGVRREDLVDAPTFEHVRVTVRRLIQGKILVGHALFNDLAALKYKQQWEMFRDTALYLPLRELVPCHFGQYPSLKRLAKAVSGINIQTSNKGHDPVEDARATMAIFLSVRIAYERSLAENEVVVDGIPASYESCFW
ncbi:hypothetical protein IAU60_003770 [Kwoniella sp. DSM 27419]